MADNAEMQGLEFQIVNDSSQAVEGLKALTNTLNRLKTATGGGVTGLSKTAQSIRELSNAMKGLNSGDASQKINRLTTALTALGQVGNVKISSSIANQLTAINTALANLKWTDGDKLTTLADGLRPLSELSRANLTTFIHQLSKLPDVIEQLEAADIDKFTQQMKDLAAAMKPFADEIQKVSTGFSAFPSKIQKLITSTERYNNTASKATKNTEKFSFSLKNLKAAGAIAVLRKLKDKLTDCITLSNAYQEDLNLFTVALGEYAEEAQNYAEKVAGVMGIDPAEWLRNQGVFNTLLTGFGNVADRAATMSQNLTQLGYDLSSFFNISVEDSMQKLQSGISGELEPLRRLGYDLSQAKLEATALSLGIDKSVSSMTQAEKAELRYYAIMTQVTTAQGDMARTLEAPANQLRILQAQLTQAARAIGNILIPALNAILPYGIAVVQIIREIAEALASLAGFTLTEVDYSGVGSLASGSEDLASGLEDSAAAAKKLKQYVAGFDELNIFPSNTESGSDTGLSGSGFDFELPTYDFIGDAVSTRVDEIKEKLKEVLPIVASIGAAILAWKMSADLIQALKLLTSLKGKNIKFSLDFPVLGLTTFLADMKEFERYLKDFQENGATFQNVVGMLSEFAGMMGDVAIALGNIKLGGALKVVQGIGELTVAIKDIADNGINWDNALTAIRGLTNIAIGIELLCGNIKAVGWTVAIQGLTTAIREIATNWDAIKQGDWSGVDKVTLIISGLEILGGLVTALDVFSKLKGVTNVSKAATAVGTVSEATESLNIAMAPMNTNLKNLAQKLAWGVLIVAEVSAAAILVVGAVWILGEELGKVAEAWQPVIENAGTVAIAVGVGAGLIAAVGLAAYGLGTLGGTAALNIGIGTAILAELGVATGLFLVEIWGIGKGLDEIGQAWQPVIDNAPTIETAIETGTALLIAIGVVTAALGTATIATVGLLPVAIGLGTAILVELAAAFVLFTESLIKVADEVGDNLSPALRRLNPKLPTLKDDMSDFTGYMTELADEISSYSKSMGSLTWSSVANAFQRLFSDNPIGDLSDDVAAIHKDVVALNEKLSQANPELETACKLMTSYAELMNHLRVLTEDNSSVGLANDMFTNLKAVGEQLVLGLAEGIDSKLPSFRSKIQAMRVQVTDAFDRAATSACNSIQRIISKLGQLPSRVTTTVDIAQTYKGNGVSVKQYASGGFPNQGELFIAREAGAEMVGSIGRKAAVANNDQIVEGIRGGVSEANEEVIGVLYAVANQVVQAIADKDSNVYLDGERVGVRVTKTQSSQSRMYGR